MGDLRWEYTGFLNIELTKPNFVLQMVLAPTGWGDLRSCEDSTACQQAVELVTALVAGTKYPTKSNHGRVCLGSESEGIWPRGEQLEAASTACPRTDSREAGIDSPVTSSARDGTDHIQDESPYLVEPSLENCSQIDSEVYLQ